MALGDILSVTIRSDGWSADVAIDGFSSGAEYDFGTLPAAPKFALQVTSEGYSAAGVLGTVQRTVYGTAVVRVPGTTDLDESAASGPLVVRIALSECIYDDDRAGGAGTSGANPVATIAAGWCTDLGGENSGSNAATIECGNESTEDYPAAFGQWDCIAGVCTADRVQSDFPVAFSARHLHGVACVLLDAEGASSAHKQSAIVTSEMRVQRSATGLYAGAHRAVMPIAGYTQGEQITLRARVYPRIGDAASVRDTDGRTTAANECLGWNTATIVCDKSAALDVVRWVATGGSDNTGDGTQGNPFATIGKALQSANVVYLTAGTHLVVGVAPATRQTSSEWKIVRPAPGVARDDCIVNIDAGNQTPRCQRICYSGVTVRLGASSAWINGEDADNFVRWKECRFISDGVGAPSVPPICYDYDCTYVHNCDGDLGAENWKFAQSFSSARIAFSIDGAALASSSAAAGMNAGIYRFTACRSIGQDFLGDKAAANVAPVADGMLVEDNEFLDFDQTGTAVALIACDAQARNGISFVGNLIEKTAGTSPAVQIADGSTADVSHVLIWHNTVAGERCNLGYNDSGSSARHRKNWSIRYNALRDYNTKHDLFGTPSAARIGGWPVSYGVHAWGNRYESSTFPGDFAGIDTLVAGVGALGYSDDRSGAGGAGQGDYLPAAGSVLRNRVPAGRRVRSGDRRGVTIPDSGAGAAGATQPPVDPASVWRAGAARRWRRRH